MSRTAKALRATSDRLLVDLETLAALETEKRQLEPGDPRLVAVAESIEELASRVLGASRTQAELTRQVEALVSTHHPEAPTAPIEETPRDMSVILGEWREAERRAAAAEPGSSEAEAAERRIEELRREYREAHERLGSSDRRAD